VAKPGPITNGAFGQKVFVTLLAWAGVVPNVPVAEAAAAMLDQIMNGFEKEPLMNEDLARIGQKVLSSTT
jgi:hypothetical protein